MKLFNQAILVALMALFLQGCQLGDDEDGTDEIDIVYLTEDSVVGTTLSNSNSSYELVLQADSNIVILENDIVKISIKGDGNTVTIDSDTLIDNISVTGDGNTIKAKSGIDLTVTDLTILGNSNDIIIFDIVNPPTISIDSDGVANIICEANGATCLP
ncbi:MAG: hypothetical protein ACJA0E_000218 [Bermanella sp.]|jgi:hypothetical protein